MPYAGVLDCNAWGAVGLLAREPSRTPDQLGCAFCGGKGGGLACKAGGHAAKRAAQL